MQTWGAGSSWVAIEMGYNEFKFKHLNFGIPIYDIY